MSGPPSYEESTGGCSKAAVVSDSKTLQCWNIRAEVDSSRAKHVSSVVIQLVPLIRGRAAQGLSKTKLVLIPAEQDGFRKGNLVGFPDDEMPILVHFEDGHGSTQFWSQEEAVSELQRQLLAAVTEVVPGHATLKDLPNRPAPAVKRSSLFSRKTSRIPEVVARDADSPVKVEARMDEIYFREENEFGLFETKRAKGVMVEVDVR